MSKDKKARKARKPNVPLYTGPVQPTSSGSGSGGGLGMEAPASTPAARAPARAETIQADYTYVVTDLKRIGLLAGGLITVLVILSFIIK